MQGIFIPAAKVNTRYFSQWNLSRIFLPDGVRADFQQGNMGLSDIHHAANFARVGLDSFPIDCHKWKEPVCRPQQLGE